MRFCSRLHEIKGVLVAKNNTPLTYTHATHETTMSRHAVARRAAPRHAAPRHAMPRHAMPRHAMPLRAMPRRAVPGRAAPGRAAPRSVVPRPMCHAAPRRAAPRRAAPRRAVPRPPRQRCRPRGSDGRSRTTGVLVSRAGVLTTGASRCEPRVIQSDSRCGIAFSQKSTR